MFKVLKNALVKVFYNEVKKDDVRLCIQVENEMPHVFDKNDAENRLISQMDIKTIEEKFNGGTYVFNHGKLIQYRDAFSLGFVRSADEMNLLSEIIGSQSATQKRGVAGMFESFRMNSINKQHFLGGEGKEFDLKIDGMQEGGEFKNRLIYSWSPFDENLIINLETERLVCTNGMVGMASFVTKAVPLVNRYQEHLDLISVQLQPQFNAILKDRFKGMSEQRSSVHTMMSAHKLLTARSKENNVLKRGGVLNDEVLGSISRMKNILPLLDVRETLGGVYKKSAFDNVEQSRHLEGNLTQFDVFNILTEVSSHTNGSFDSTSKIQKEINKLVFDELNDKKNVKGNIPKIDSSSDHRRAFFGDDE